MYNVLFVDDDQNVLRINKEYFDSHGYSAFVADNAKDALSLAQENDFDCIVLDIILPTEDDGYQLCKSIREETNAPIIFLSSLTEKDFVYRGFSVGGEDYMTKPYDLKELMMRAEAHITRYRMGSMSDKIISVPPLEMNMTSRVVKVNGTPVPLTAVEFGILSLLCENQGNPISPADIYTAVWRMPDINAVHTVHSHIGRIRRKLDSLSPDHQLIQTEWGKGYLIVPYPQKK